MTVIEASIDRFHGSDDLRLALTSEGRGFDRGVRLETLFGEGSDLRGLSKVIPKIEYRIDDIE